MDLTVADAFTIPESELEWTFTTPGGPGGQHANRNATRAELAWNLEHSSAIGEEIRTRLMRALGSRVRNGVVSVVSGESRSQWRNRQIARRRLAVMLELALRERRRQRIPTKPSKATQKSRVEDKRRRGAEKRLRRRPDIDEP